MAKYITLPDGTTFELIGNKFPQSCTNDPNTTTPPTSKNNYFTFNDNSKYTVIPHACIYPHKITFYNEIEGLFHERHKFSFEEKTKIRGKLSLQAKSKLDKAINWLVYLSKRKKVIIKSLEKTIHFKVNFITLSLPASQIKSITSKTGTKFAEKDWKNIWFLVNSGCADVEFWHDDNTIKKECLNHFLIELRNKYKVKFYVWKAETQLNGNIHFHFTLDKFIWQEDLRNTWNRIIDKLGYVRRYQAKFKHYDFNLYKKEFLRSSGLTVKKLLGRFETSKRNNWLDPNSTDIHAVKNITNLAAYLCKYMKKNDLFRRQIHGNLWYCSESLSKFDKLNIIDSSTEGAELNKLWNLHPKKQFVKDFICMLKIPIWVIRKFMKNSKILSLFDTYVSNINNELNLNWNNCS